MNRIKVDFYLNIGPHYREELFIKLLEDTDMIVNIIYGSNNNINIKAFNIPDNHLNNVYFLKNIYYNNIYLLWQNNLLKMVFVRTSDINIFTGDMYCLSNWIGAFISRIKGTKVVFWSHGFYGNEGLYKFILRKIFFKLAHYHLLYNNRGKKIMIQNGFDERNLLVIYNSLAYSLQKDLRSKYLNLDKKDVFPFFHKPELPVLIYVGRLTNEKKLDLLINAVININRESIKVNLLLLGDGIARNHLMNLSECGIKEKWIYFIGACYNERTLSRIISNTDLCVSPGNVGLTAMHSLGYGTPVCTHNNFMNQMPEVEAIENYKTGIFFEEDNLLDLIDNIQFWLKENRDNREDVRQRCYEVIDQYYNPEYQVSIFKDFFKSTHVNK